MNDRELLEAAAKAAGIKALRDPRGVMRNCTGFDPAMNIFSAPEWSPLTDDGDALRLAARLGIDLAFDLHGEFCAATTARDNGNRRKELIELWSDNGDDPNAATRRAIVRAAAAMGAA